MDGAILEPSELLVSRSSYLFLFGATRREIVRKVDNSERSTARVGATLPR